MQRLIIHSGLHKTGTTSVQKFLSSAALGLDALGFVYPNRIDQFNHHHVVAHCYFGRNIEYLKQFLSALGVLGNGKDIILSSEEFGACFLDVNFAESFSEYYRSHFNLEIVLTLRRQDYLLESVFREVVCDSDNRTMAVLDFYDFDFRERVEILSQVFGRERVTLVPYNHADSTREVLKSIFGSEYRHLRYRPSERFNTSIHRRAALAISQICEVPADGNGIIRGTIKRNANLVTDDGIRFILSPARRKAFAAQFDKSNAAMLRDMGLPDCRTFFADEPEGRKWHLAKPVTTREMQAILRSVAERRNQDLKP
jgi:hypothetical protein